MQDAGFDRLTLKKRSSLVHESKTAGQLNGEVNLEAVAGRSRAAYSDHLRNQASWLRIRENSNAL